MKFGVARKWAPDYGKYILQLYKHRVDYWEIGFAFGVPEVPKDLTKVAEKYNVKLSGHLPFWINLGDLKKKQKNFEYLKKGFYISEIFETVCVFHIGYYKGLSPTEFINNAISQLKELLREYDPKGKIGIETTGRIKEAGSLEEVLRIVKEINDERIIPVIDFAHIFARNYGKFPVTIEDFLKILESIEEFDFYYFHAGGVLFDRRGEKKHVSIVKSPFPIENLMEALRIFGKDIVLIIESPDSFKDIEMIRKGCVKRRDLDLESFWIRGDVSGYNVQ